MTTIHWNVVSSFSTAWIFVKCLKCVDIYCWMNCFVYSSKLISPKDCFSLSKTKLALFFSILHVYCKRGCIPNFFIPLYAWANREFQIYITTNHLQQCRFKASQLAWAWKCVPSVKMRSQTVLNSLSDSVKPLKWSTAIVLSENSSTSSSGRMQQERVNLLPNVVPVIVKL